jgi:transcriptional regulator with XRE-family HTH domain
MKPGLSFPRLVTEAMARKGLGLREACRRAGLDPSFLSKVLAGKRNPPSEEETLRRLAQTLGLDEVELIVSAGLIPSDWGALCSDPELLRAVHAVATGGRRPAVRRAPAAAPLPRVESTRPEREQTPAPVPAFRLPSRGLSEELL